MKSVMANQYPAAEVGSRKSEVGSRKSEVGSNRLKLLTTGFVPGPIRSLATLILVAGLLAVCTQLYATTAIVCVGEGEDRQCWEQTIQPKHGFSPGSPGHPGSGGGVGGDDGFGGDGGGALEIPPLAAENPDNNNADADCSSLVEVRMAYAAGEVSFNRVVTGGQPAPGQLYLLSYRNGQSEVFQAGPIASSIAGGQPAPGSPCG